ncbi:HIT domain-containing protein [Georgenia sp. TF02-10]|uniref:HIT family protein n=1 Tax=Georgenia sp. TF02-10 TaxID=2917725 RepID=UPI001FA78242|nr:HIT domain-containing protein [Georgenia sp. TF02-10]UNX54099.1 HIT domain-containing protein [Georgenia sp. TF02-10]
MSDRKPSCALCERIESGRDLRYARFDVVGFEPLAPVVPGHLLFVPRRHAEHPAAYAVMEAMAEAELYAGGQDEDYNLITSSGPAATMTQSHVHVHYVPRRAGDGLALPWTATRTVYSVQEWVDADGIRDGWNAGYGSWTGSRRDAERELQHARATYPGERFRLAAAEITDWREEPTDA